MKQLLLLFIIIALLSTIGCMSNKNSKDSQNSIKQQDIAFQPIQHQSNTNQKIAYDVKKLLMEQDTVTEVSVVNNHQDIIAAINVKPLSRFQLKKIENRLQKKITKHFPNKKVTLSTDRKIMIELNRIEKSMQSESLSKEQLKKKINKVKTLSKEQT